MPRFPAVSVEEIFEELKGKEIFEPNGTLVSSTERVWKRASLRLNNKITPTTLRFYVAKDWKNLRQKLKTYNTQYGKHGFIYTSSRLIDRCLEMKFDMSIPKERWELIKPVVDEQGKKRLRKGWQRQVAEVILEKTELPCLFTNLKGTTYRSTNDFKFNGDCSECGNPISGVYFFQYGMHGFEIATRNTKNIEHQDKLPPISNIEMTDSLAQKSAQKRKIDEGCQSTKEKGLNTKTDTTKVEVKPFHHMVTRRHSAKLRKECQSENQQSTKPSNTNFITIIIPHGITPGEPNVSAKILETQTAQGTPGDGQCENNIEQHMEPIQAEKIDDAHTTQVVQHEDLQVISDSAEETPVVQTPETQNGVPVQESIQIELAQMPQTSHETHTEEPNQVEQAQMPQTPHEIHTEEPNQIEQAKMLQTSHGTHTNEPNQVEQAQMPRTSHEIHTDEPNQVEQAKMPHTPHEFVNEEPNHVEQTQIIEISQEIQEEIEIEEPNLRELKHDIQFATKIENQVLFQASSQIATANDFQTSHEIQNEIQIPAQKIIEHLGESQSDLENQNWIPT
ncbi:hypothetical protein QAD02_004338 [Eretmocerus hayati]|uniref:Uncharacterized protein n=1 Tax=Eretmocerus hayati TaxID=131215 RepID=A0ACC2NS78_9HYME|nr:hypothetical protein QAD02_004338 [Eretmocerus hayati]